MLILIHNRAEAEESEVQRHLDHCSRKSERFFATIEEIIAQEQSRKAYVSILYIFFDFSHDVSCRMSDSLPSATKILQPVDVHIGSTGKYTFGSEIFHSKSGILHEARALQDRYSSLSSSSCSSAQITQFQRPGDTGSIFTRTESTALAYGTSNAFCGKYHRQ